jgi:hypothetical protein
MAIANELSSDVATAVLAHKQKGQSNTTELKEILLNFYSALRPLTTESRRRRWRAQSSPATPATGQAASNNG